MQFLVPAGALPQRLVLIAVTAAMCGWIAVDTAWLKLSPGLAQATYDAMVRARLWAPPPDPRIAIVDIDEASLAALAPEFGRWPWSRDTLATVMTYLERQKVAAIVWDIAFTDADRTSPGGDAAFDAAARQSPHSHFPVVRLPAAGDRASQVTAAHLPQLWLRAGADGAGVALIPPALAGVAAGRLGYNNVRPDSDGVVRRYRHFERLPGGGVIRSIPLSVVAASTDAPAQRRILDRIAAGAGEESLIVWPASSSRYERIPFHQLFRAADSQADAGAQLAHRILVVGSTAPSLHDIHPTPLAATAPGVETLATAIDNALHGRYRVELPKALQAGLAIVLCLLLAWRADRKSVSALEPLLFALPAVLLAVSFASLHAGPVFLDLQLAATFSLLLLAVLRFWNNLRRAYWAAPPQPGGSLVLWAWARPQGWDDRAVDGLIALLQQHAPAFRLVLQDAQSTWPARLRWPELTRVIAITGPAQQLAAVQPRLEAGLDALDASSTAPVQLPAGATREALALAALTQWGRLAAGASAVQVGPQERAA